MAKKAESAGAVICGAGIAGVSAAYFLARFGVRRIVLLDERPPLTLTSDRSTECYRNWWPDPAMRQLMDRSIDLMEELANSSANVFRMNRRGYVYCTGDAGRLNVFSDQARRVSESGAGELRVHEGRGPAYAASPPDGYRDQPTGADLLLGKAAIAEHFPHISREAVGALHVRRAGWISAQQMGMYLLEQARQAGAELRPATLEGVEITAGRVSGVVLDGGDRISCDVFVNAAGPFLREVGRLVGVDLPVAAEIHLKAVIEDTLHAIDRASPLLIWSDPQRLPWTDDEIRMFEAEPELAWLTQVFPGGAHTRPEGGLDAASALMLWDYRTMAVEPVFPVPLDEQYPEIVLRGLTRMLPGLQAYVGRLSRPRLDGGYYMRTRENRPLIGPMGVPGAFVVGALSGFGIMSGCAAGELLAAHVTGHSLPEYAGAFSVNRYDDPLYPAQLEALADDGEL